jgi:hypothetical protein
MKKTIKIQELIKSEEDAMIIKQIQEFCGSDEIMITIEED